MRMNVGETPVLSRRPADAGVAASQYPDKLDRGDIHVWRAEFSCSQRMVPQLESYLAADELKRANRFVFDRHRQNFVMARGLLRMVLARYLGEAPTRLQFVYGDHGKPALAIDPAPVSFNVSHSCDRLLIAVAAGSDVGVDIEKVTAGRACEGVSGEFSQAEQLALADLGAGKRVEAFFKCWTSKEAYIKGVGAGLAIPLADFDVCVDPDKPPRLLRPFGCGGSRWFLHRIHEGKHYAATLAASCPDARLSVFEAVPASARATAEDERFAAYSR